MNRAKPVMKFSESPTNFFRESDWDSLPELSSAVIIILKTEQFSSEEIDRLESFLSEEETGKSKRFRFFNDKRSYIIVHGLLRWMLGRHFGISPKAIEFTYNLNGKPSISGYSGNMFFNLSHSSGVSILAFDPENEIGADVEKVDEKFDYELIVQHIFYRKRRRVHSENERKFAEKFL